MVRSWLHSVSLSGFQVVLGFGNVGNVVLLGVFFLGIVSNWQDSFDVCIFDWMFSSDVRFQKVSSVVLFEGVFLMIGGNYQDGFDIYILDWRLWVSSDVRLTKLVSVVQFWEIFLWVIWNEYLPTISSDTRLKKLVSVFLFLIGVGYKDLPFHFHKTIENVSGADRVFSCRKLVHFQVMTDWRN